MYVLFIHRAFPAQFGRLALELSRRYGWRCSFLVEHLSRCPSPSPEMLHELAITTLPRLPEAQQEVPWSRNFTATIERAHVLAQVMQARRELSPDLIVGHGALTPTLFLRDVLTCPIIDYCEYYFAREHCDLTYRLDLPPPDFAPFYPRCINAATLVNLLACDSAYTATRWQRDRFPPRFHGKIEVYHEGIDTDLYQPRPHPLTVAGHAIPSDARVVTFVSRGLESVRGFDLFVKLAARIQRVRSDVVFIVAGEEQTHYGWDRQHTGGVPFKQWALARENLDPSRLLFLGHVEPAQLAEVLARSDLHVYPSVPFVPSWSLLNALSCECVVLAADTPPVREVLTPDRTGLVAPLFDLDQQLDIALRVLADPGAFRPLGQAARINMVERFGLDVAIPQLKAYFERVGTSGNVPVRP
jgi:glycosyltransferase involved in cell wall biosynthesis